MYSGFFRCWLSGFKTAISNNYSGERIKNNSGYINIKLMQPELGMKLNNLHYNANIAFTPTTGVFV